MTVPAIDLRERDIIGMIAVLRGQRDDIDAAIRALRRVQRGFQGAVEAGEMRPETGSRIAVDAPSGPETSEPGSAERPGRIAANALQPPHRDRIADGRPATMRAIMEAHPGHEWTSQQMGAALNEVGHDRDLAGPVLHRRVAATFAGMGDVERVGFGRYRLAVKPGTNGGSE